MRPLHQIASRAIAGKRTPISGKSRNKSEKDRHHSRNILSDFRFADKPSAGGSGTGCHIGALPGLTIARSVRSSTRRRMPRSFRRDAGQGLAIALMKVDSDREVYAAAQKEHRSVNAAPEIHD
jgi:hypothetical protein